jgi:CheY-like chemotaxis protein
MTRSGNGQQSCLDGCDVFSAKGGLMSQTATGVQSATSEATHVNGRTPLVLIADGNAVSRGLREAQLRAAGLRVSVARTGFEAIVKASCQVPDVILLDDSLSDIEATETGRLLTTCPVTSHIPVVRLLQGRRLPRRILTRLSRG